MTVVSMGIPRLPGQRSLAADRPDVPVLLDRFGRVARDLRISVTEKCSLRCTYCMPAEGLPGLDAEQVLSAAEIARLVGVAHRELGVREVRFTGGEPLVRKDIVDIVARSATAAPDVALSMTTNGIGLDRRAAALVQAGLGRVNISLDTVDRAHFAALTRRDRLPAVLAGIDGALAAGLAPVKINAVLMRETLAGAADLLAWCLERGVALRFIEQMPLDADREWARSTMVPAAELLAVLRERFDLTEIGRSDPSAPAEEWTVDGGPATVGIIASVTRSFCSDCDRTRLTAEGTVRSCLFSDVETDLRAVLRRGADDAEIADLWRGAMWEKSAGHGMDDAGFVPPERSMGAIGG
ncbi:GTP 3',8-cyclase MoaA [Rhodococcoides corynebacterioides]|uniref:GTP 3',8-cyclase n=1 Tax=Rhodococcoides corynebacterioides TaxID=53972 RepID=A0ABS7P2V5_9NOCA|nr:GTP 3',8-cyclase MoaA [Rhodococcus corynebacterioides]MBY6366754.1 GTP 3',8-cyclase MoaA [Rhodococcus corynebacterioides]MBY6409295.1 GTP 3',8-cyclase MoaA [Rhodococcus corynebacterioides]